MTGFEQIKMLLHGREVLGIERSLAEADNNIIAIYCPGERVRGLVGEYITQRRDAFTLRGVCI